MTTSTQRTRLIGACAFSVLTAVCLGSVGYLLASASTSSHPASHRIGAGILVVLAAVFAWIALSASGVRRRSAAAGLAIRVEPTEVARGENVQASVVKSRPQRPGRRLEIGVVCVERFYVDTGDGQALATVPAVQEWRAVPPRGRREVITFDVPADAPYSYEGKRVSWSWAVAIGKRRRRQPRRQRFAHKLLRTEPFWVQP